jgi:hypothetical protein
MPSQLRIFAIRLLMGRVYAVSRLHRPRRRIRPSRGMTVNDTEFIAGQLADLTRTVEGMANQLKTFRERADSQQERRRPSRSGSTLRRESSPRSVSDFKQQRMRSGNQSDLVRSGTHSHAPAVAPDGRIRAFGRRK